MNFPTVTHCDTSDHDPHHPSSQPGFRVLLTSPAPGTCLGPLVSRLVGLGSVFVGFGLIWLILGRFCSSESLFHQLKSSIRFITITYHNLAFTELFNSPTIKIWTSGRGQFLASSCSVSSDSPFVDLFSTSFSPKLVPQSSPFPAFSSSLFSFCDWFPFDDFPLLSLSVSLLVEASAHLTQASAT